MLEKQEILRHKNRKRFHYKYDSNNMFQQSLKDKPSMVINISKSVAKNSKFNSIVETNLNVSDENSHSPESVRHESLQEDPLPYKDFHSEIISRIPQINLDTIDDAVKKNVIEIEHDSTISAAEKHTISENIEMQNACFTLNTIENGNVVKENLKENILEKTISFNESLKGESKMDSSWKNEWFNVTNLSECSSFETSPATSLYKTFTSCDLQHSASNNFHTTSRNNTTNDMQTYKHQLENSPTYLSFESTQKPLETENSVNARNLYENQHTFLNLEELQNLKNCLIPGTPESLECTNEKLSNPFNRTQLIFCDCNDHMQCFTNKNDNQSKREIEQNYCVQSSLSPIKNSHTTLQLESNKSSLSFISPFDLPEPESIITQIEENQQIVDFKDKPMDSKTFVQLLTVSNSKILEKELQNSSQYLGPPDVSKERLQVLKWPFIKVFELCTWFVKNVTDLAKKGHMFIRQLFLSIITSQTDPKADEFAHIIETIHTTNEHTISALTEKLSLLSKELNQVRINSEVTLTALTTEVSSLRETSNNLVETNNVLMKELKTLHKALDNFQSKPPMPPPPPPPPCPPSPLLSTSSQTSDNKSIKTLTRECSTPVLNRPVIVVEDLLKVKLRKAPRNDKENKMNSVSTPKGPVVSLDMLLNVKLKSVRSRSNNWNAKSPKRTPRVNKTLPFPTLNLSPIRPTAESSLQQILKQVDVNKREPKRALLVTKHDENNTSKNA